MFASLEDDKLGVGRQAQQKNNSKNYPLCSASRTTNYQLPNHRGDLRFIWVLNRQSLEKHFIWKSGIEPAWLGFWSLYDKLWGIFAKKNQGWLEISDKLMGNQPITNVNHCKIGGYLQDNKSINRFLDEFNFSLFCFCFFRFFLSFRFGRHRQTRRQVLIRF